MRKLNLLKTIVDYVFILSIIMCTLLIVFSILLILGSETLKIPDKFFFNGIEIIGIWSKLGLTINIANFGLTLYILFNFKKLLGNFKEKLIFEIETCILLNRIGRLLIYSSFIYILAEMILRLSKNDIYIDFGFGPFLYLVSLGLFFIVLAEVFKMGKQLKEENELTI